MRVKKVKINSKKRKMSEGRPVVVLVGMAGAGKSTLLSAMAAHAGLGAEAATAYPINLDPAVRSVGYKPRIDIRRTVYYKEVMQQYGLGPNGAIMTALNLFATRFDQVLDLMHAQREKHRAAGSQVQFLVDTPGQLEAFTWSASGQLIAAALATEAPTVVLYVVDAARCAQSPSTFMSNMLYAVSILYKLRLPLVVALNKCDAPSTEVVEEWMRDLDVFRDALRFDERYMSTYTRSVALVLETFYSQLAAVRVSATTGANLDALFAALAKAGSEFMSSRAGEALAQRDELAARSRAQLQDDLQRDRAQHPDLVDSLQWREEAAEDDHLMA